MSSNATSTVLTLLPSLPSLDNTFGAVLIGTFLGLILYGLTVHQTLTYFRVYTADAFLMKFMIFCLALLDTGNAVVTMHVCYHYLVTNYFDPFSLLDGVWSIRMLPVLMTTTFVIAQLFYIRRVYLLGSGYRYVAIVAAICAIGAVGFGTVFSVECFIHTTFFEFQKFTVAPQTVQAVWKRLPGYTVELRNPDEGHPNTHLLTLFNDDHTITVEYRHTLEDDDRKLRIEGDVKISRRALDEVEDVEADVRSVRWWDYSRSWRPSLDEKEVVFTLAGKQLTLKLCLDWAAPSHYFPHVEVVRMEKTTPAALLE
ncbi:hypothetical protein DICSQDRAFT_172689 [Dichomitus squalens LYAD-421 SS1]|uniref:Uncharacterized protein n=1 Tax=Dichomitus squalens (strain LYAD-421) TaxID=732165 RepID=R7SRX5_DICSQ|nr:uncharacterized protein DICSQDRAFT_172689 [Dichomitus squalens LYAD-421 SS1]EJF58678.1 hypothetical protein DICSQDRAFT_172689 [Dichomitus squalens LYAD-421 SS1]